MVVVVIFMLFIRCFVLNSTHKGKKGEREKKTEIKMSVVLKGKFNGFMQKGKKQSGQTLLEKVKRKKCIVHCSKFLARQLTII